jgi:hypothetical protein
MIPSNAARIPLNEKSRAGILHLIESSHARPMDFNTVLPWERAVDRARLPKPVEQCWIYGTPYYDMLAPEQRHELLWKETARDVSMFITLEQTIPPLYIGYINQYQGELTPEVYEYLMLFSKEEIVHTLVFQHYMKLGNLPQFAPPDGLHDLLAKQLPAMHPVAGIICTLLIEWLAELAAMYASQGEDIEPMTRSLFYQHHLDESRHIAFGRWIAESYFEKSPQEDAARMKQLMRGVLARLVPQFTYNPEIARHTSYVFPIKCADQDAIEAVRKSAANTALNEMRFAPMFNWLRKLEVV